MIIALLLIIKVYGLLSVLKVVLALIETSLSAILVVLVTHVATSSCLVVPSVVVNPGLILVSELVLVHFVRSWLGLVDPLAFCVHLRLVIRCLIVIKVLRSMVLPLVSIIILIVLEGALRSASPVLVETLAILRVYFIVVVPYLAVSLLPVGLLVVTTIDRDSSLPL